LKKKGSIEDKTSNHMKQLEMVQSLRRLLQVKEVCQKKIDENIIRAEVGGWQRLDIT
jgi:hypothetical protein